ncbi:MAG: hypothetical protein CMN28_09980 [Salinisphaeraceae bacterium]|nr:hypothetical protein [Salinisphaeraceae bacterium]
MRFKWLRLAAKVLHRSLGLRLLPKTLAQVVVLAIAVVTPARSASERAARVECLRMFFTRTPRAPVQAVNSSEQLGA